MSDRFAKLLSNALLNEFKGRIYLDDVSRREDQRTPQFHTRALSAMVVRYLMDCPSTAAPDFVTDGADDHDIDALAYDESDNRIWFVQTKWSADGVAKFEEKDAKSYTVGIKYMLNLQLEKFNKRFRPHDKTVETILSNDPKVGFVIAMARRAPLHHAHLAVLEHMAEEVKGWYSRPATVEVLTLDKLLRIARAGMGEPPIALDVNLVRVETDAVPHRVYFGTATAEEVARWHAEHGEHLFRRNIRTGLGRTSVNEAIRESLVKEPERFWDKNNGLTLVARSGAIGMNGTGRLNDVSVVNGAQTVSTIAAVVKEHPEAADARVHVKISMIGEDADDELIRDITRAVNTQNRVEIRDLASLYEQQDELRLEFSATLGLAYTIRHTEAAPAEDEGCTNEEALIALACGHADPRYAVQAKVLPDKLWDRTAGGPYRNLFRQGITAAEIWRAVRLSRAVAGVIGTARKKYQGRAAQIAEHGDLLTAHLVAAQLADGPGADRPGKEDWERSVLAEAAPTALNTLKWLITAVDKLYPKSHPSALFKNDEKCRALTAYVLDVGGSGARGPELPDDYVKGRAERRNRMPNLVPLLAKHEAIPDGTLLEFRPTTREQRQLFQRWNAEDPRRSRGTWVNDGRRQVRWEVDGQLYATSALALKLVNSLGLKKRVPAVRGPDCWYVLGQGSLKDIGLRLIAELNGEAGEPETDPSP